MNWDLKILLCTTTISSSVVPCSALEPIGDWFEPRTLQLLLFTNKILGLYFYFLAHEGVISPAS